MHKLWGKKKKRNNYESRALTKKVKVKNDDSYECESCQKLFYGGNLAISVHLQGAKHKRLMHVYYLSDYFKQFNIDWDVHNSTQYYCQIHEQLLLVESSILFKHIENYHKQEEIINNNNNTLNLILPPVESVVKVFKSKIWLVDFPNKNKPLNEYFRTYEVIDRPIRLVEDNPIPNFICDLRNDVFSKEDLMIITKVASWLERGKAIM